MNTSADSVRVAHPLFQVEEIVHPTSPRQLVVVEINVDLAMSLNAQWHSVLPKTNKSNLTRNRHSVFYGAAYRSVWYAVAIWTSPVAGHTLPNGQRALELRRLAICQDAPRFTATWMLAQMRRRIIKKFPDVERLLSYQAVDHHRGTIYKAANWQPVDTTKEHQDWGGSGSVEPGSGVRPNRTRTKPVLPGAKIRWEKWL